VRGIHEANNRRYGWQSDHLVTGTMQLPTAVYPGGKEITDFQRLALERLEALPGVASAPAPTTRSSRTSSVGGAPAGMSTFGFVATLGKDPALLDRTRDALDRDDERGLAQRRVVGLRFR